MTSLQLQLDQIAEDVGVQASTFLESRAVLRSSFLFDPKVASSIGKDVVFALAQNGFRAFCQVDSSFSKFENSFFSVSASLYERLNKSNENNLELDALINDCLLALTPFLQLSSVHKILEWLIFQFQAHIFNVDNLFYCALLYHDTNLLYQVVKVIHRYPARWQWIGEHFKERTILSKKQLVRYCVANLDILNGIFKFNRQLILYHSEKSYANIYRYNSFTTVITMAVSEKIYKRSASENFSDLIFHMLGRALKSKFLTLKYFGITVLSSNLHLASFSQESLEYLATLLLKKCLHEFTYHSITCFILMLMTQSHFVLPIELQDIIIENPQITEIFLNAQVKFDTYALLKALGISLFKNAILSKQPQLKLFSFLWENCSDKGFMVEECLNIIMQSFVNSCDVNVQLVKMIEVSHSEKFNDFFTKRKNSEMDIALKKFLNISQCPQKYIDNSSTEHDLSLVLGFTHYLEEFRVMSIRKWYQIIQNEHFLQNPSIEFHQPHILNMLIHDSNTVRAVILSSPYLLRSVCNENSLLETLFSLLNILLANKTEFDFDVFYAVYELLGFYSKTSSKALLIVLLPFEIAEVFHLDVSRLRSILKNCDLQYNLETTEDISQLLSLNYDLVQTTCAFISCEEHVYLRNSAVGLLSHFIKKSSSSFEQLIFIVETICDSDVKDCQKHFDLLISELFMKFDFDSLQNTSVASELYNSNENFRILCHLVKFVLSHEKLHVALRTLVQTVISKKLFYSLFVFISVTENIFGIMNRARALKIISMSLTNKVTATDKRLILFSGLLGLISDAHVLRFTAILLLKEFTKISPSHKLVHEIIDSSEEILLDPSQMGPIISDWVKPEAPKSPSLKRAHDEQQMFSAFSWLIKNKNFPLSMISAFLDILEHASANAKHVVFCSIHKDVITRTISENDKSFYERSLSKLALMFSKKSVDYLDNDFIKFFDENQNYSVVSNALSRLNQKFFVCLNTDLQKVILEKLIQLHTSSFKILVKPCFESLQFSAQHFVECLLGNLLAADDLKKKKLDDNFDSKKLLSILESIIVCNNVRNEAIMISPLTDFLSVTDVMASDVRSNIQCLILTILSRIVIENQDRNKDAFKTLSLDVVINTLTSTQSFQVQDLCLQLLSHICRQSPTSLPKVMPVFAFMSESIVKRDDEQTLDLAVLTLRSIIPAVVTDSQELTTDTINVCTTLVVALVQAAAHRKYLLLKTLVEIIGVKRCLWVVVLLLVKADVLGSGHSKDLDHTSAVTLINEFKVEEQMKCHLILLKFAATTMSKYFETESNTTEPFNAIFNMEKESPKNQRIMCFSTISFISTSLSTHGFLTNVCLEEVNINKLCVKSIKSTFNLITHANKYVNDHVNKMEPLIERFFKSVSDKCFLILKNINSLLSTKSFFAIIKEIMNTSDVNVEIKAFELFNAQLVTLKNKCEEECLDELLTFILLIKERVMKGGDSDVIYHALTSLKILVKYYGGRAVDEFSSLLSLTRHVCRENSSNIVRCAAILLFAELCSSQNANVLKFMSKMVDFIVNENVSHHLVAISLLTATNKIVSSIPKYLSSFLPSLLSFLTKFASPVELFQKEAIQQRLLLAKSCIAENIEIRVLLGAFEKHHSQTMYADSLDIVLMADILSQSLSKSDVEAITAVTPKLKHLFLLFLDFRCQSTSSSFHVVESSVNRCMSTFVMSLNESTFRMFFIQFFNWATEQGKDLRIWTFYYICSKLVQELKLIFLLFVGHIVAHMCECLNSLKEQNDVELKQYILTCLYHCFLYENGFLVTSEHFQMLSQSISNQIELFIELEEYSSHVSEFVIPCVSQFMLACKEDHQRKQLHQMLLVYSKHSSTIVRESVVRLLQEVVKKLGDDYLTLLPEAIPCLAELLEDESEAVEKATQTTVIVYENILGEPVRQYFGQKE